MTKFKVGDKVVCIGDSIDGSFTGHPGETFTVSAVYENDMDFVEMTSADISVDVSRFELVKEESDLESLIATANAGIKAEHLLLSQYTDKVQRKHNNDDDSQWYNFSSNPYKGYSVYRQNPKPTFAPFYVGPKEGYDCRDNPDNKPWKVELKDSFLCIGTNWSFDPIPLMNALADLTRDSISGCTVSGLSLDCMRNGIVIQGKYQISWEDAELVLRALEGVYLK
jgi:hypothetical protein